MPHEPNRPLTPHDVARRLGISTRTVARWTEQGRLRAQVLPNGHRRYRVEDVDALVHDFEPAGQDDDSGGEDLPDEPDADPDGEADPASARGAA